MGVFAETFELESESVDNAVDSIELAAFAFGKILEKEGTKVSDFVSSVGESLYGNIDRAEVVLFEADSNVSGNLVVEYDGKTGNLAEVVKYFTHSDAVLVHDGASRFRSVVFEEDVDPRHDDHDEREGIYSANDPPNGERKRENSSDGIPAGRVVLFSRYGPFEHARNFRLRS